MYGQDAQCTFTERQEAEFKKPKGYNAGRTECRMVGMPNGVSSYNNEKRWRFYDISLNF